MKRSLWAGCAFALALFSGLFVRHVPSTLAATTTASSGHMAPIRCSTPGQVLAALAIARKTNNVVIELQPTTYFFPTELVVQGNGTTIHGNGATILTSAYYSGLIDPLTNCPTQGTAIVVKPLLGPSVKYAKQTNGFWFNPRGTCIALNRAAGGGAQNFYEQAPCQDSSTAPLSTYSLYAPYIVPAKNITIQDLNIRFYNRLSDSAIYVTYSQNVTIQNIAVQNTPADVGVGGGPGDIWGLGSQNVTFDSCSSVTYIQMNSCTGCTVSNSDVGGVTFEEFSRSCTVKNNSLETCRTNDILCSDITYDSNTFAAEGNGDGAFFGVTRLRFTNNTVLGLCWLGSDTRNAVMSGNTGPGFYDYAAKSAGNTVTPNTVIH